MTNEISICWLRRDLRLVDNTALYHALSGKYPVLLVFIFDTAILDKLPNKKDKRLTFIHQALQEINKELHKHHSSLHVFYGAPIDAFKKTFETYTVKEVYANHDYEPYAIERDKAIEKFLSARDIAFHTFKDQVIFEKAEVMKPGGGPYTVFTPYSNTWKKKLEKNGIKEFPSEKHLANLVPIKSLPFPELEDIGFEKVGTIAAQPTIDKELIRHYHETRNLPAAKGTTRLSPHLRFGTISVRHLVKLAIHLNGQWLNELIWREFFMMILFHFPHVVNQSFKRKYDNIEWRNDEKEFECWCKGETGYPMVDAGMRQLNETGWMHNRVRMIVASFLTKHLLIDWRWGEAYFAEKLLDYELSSNNGNWQWAAGSGCDAAPYFRIFNPSEQLKKFDPQLKYVKTWIKDFDRNYILPIVDHDFARKRALDVYKKSLND